MVTSKASVYSYYDNDVDGKFGTNQTSSGIDISPTEFTASVAMPTYKGSPTPNYNGHQIGDVLMVRNNSVPNSPAILVLATDVGSLPNAQIDLVDGIASQSLGMETIYSEKSGRAIGVNHSENVTVTKVGSVKTDGDRRANYREAMAVIKDINVNGKPISELEPLLKSKVDGVDFNQTVESLAPTIKQDQLRQSPQKDFQLKDSSDEFYQPDNTRRRKQDQDLWLQSLPEEDRAFFTGILALILFVMGEHEQANELLAGVFGDHIASPESYAEYDRKTGGSLGGRENALQLGKYNQDYQVKNAPENWGKATPEAIAQAMAGKVIYQEQKGDGKTSYGTLTLTNEEGKVVSFPVLSGGAGRGSLMGTANGTGAVDERYGVVVPEYTVTNFRGNRTDKLAHAMGGFSFDLRSNGSDYIAIPGEDRGEFRIHADGNKDGKTLGCIGCKPADSEAMIAAIRSHQDNVAFAILPSQDKNNELATHFKTAPSKEVAEKSDKQEKDDAVEQAKKLTAGIELKEMKVEGWPPGVDSSVLDAAKAAEAQRLS